MSTSDGNNNDKTKTMNNQNEPKRYFMKIEPPRMIDATIIIKPPSKGGVEEGKKDSLSKRVKGVKHGLHLDNKEK
jgi:hypothetical protein